MARKQTPPGPTILQNFIEFDPAVFELLSIQKRQKSESCGSKTAGSNSMKFCKIVGPGGVCLRATFQLNCLNRTRVISARNSIFYHFPTLRPCISRTGASRIQIFLGLPKTIPGAYAVSFIPKLVGHSGTFPRHYMHSKKARFFEKSVPASDVRSDQ